MNPTHLAAEKLIKEIQAQEFKPVYLLHGDEPYYIDLVIKQFLEHTLTPEERDFNQVVLYGEELEVRSIDSEARQFPMMSTKRLVVVREAEKVKQLEAGLEAYIKTPTPSTVLVLAYGKKYPANRKLYKQIAKVGSSFKSEKTDSIQFMLKWIAHHISSVGLQASHKAVEMLAEAVGSSLNTVVKEVEKLQVVLTERKSNEITPDLVEEHVGISREYNIFNFISAIGLKQQNKVYRMLKHFSEQTNDANLFVSSSLLYNHFTRLLLYHYMTGDKSNEYTVAKHIGCPPFKVKEYLQSARLFSAAKIVYIISQLREYDARAKGVGNRNTSAYELFKELLTKIFN